MKSSMEVPQKIKNRTTIRSSNSSSGYLSHENKNTNTKDLCSIIYNSRDVQENKVTICRWMDEEDVACVCGKYIHTRTRNGIVLSYLKNESLSFATNWMDLKWLPTPLFLLEEFHRERRLAGCSPWGCKELDTTEWLTLVLSHRSVRWTVSYTQRWAEDTICPSFSTNKKGLLVHLLFCLPLLCKAMMLMRTAM